MIISCYGNARLDSSNLAQSAGLLLLRFLHACKQDPRNANLPRFDNAWLAYRHELRIRNAQGELIDEWQAPFQTAKRKIGDCEDLAVYWCMYPGLPEATAQDFSVAAYQAGPHLVHAVTASKRFSGFWMSDPDTVLYIPSLDRFVRKGEGFGLLDPSWIAGMPHPYGPNLSGSDPKDPRYFVGSNKCTPLNDIIDRLKVGDVQIRKGIDGL